MRTIPSRFKVGVAAALVAVCASMAVATVVDAQTPPPAAQDGAGMRPPMPPRDGMRGEMRGGPEMQHGHGMRMMREGARLKTSLQLNAQQSALWERAVATMKPQGDMREQMKTHHDRMGAMLDDPNFDPRRMAAEMDRLAAEHKARMTTTREAWIAFYDSLNPVQRGQVREFLREKMSKHDHGMHERMEWMHHDGKAPMAPQTPPPPSTISR